MVVTPEKFIGFMNAQRDDLAMGKPDPLRTKAFNDAVPSTHAQVNYLIETPVTASYVEIPDGCVDAFVFTNTRVVLVHCRRRASHKSGNVRLQEKQLSQMDERVLPPEMTRQPNHDPVVFELRLQQAKRGRVLSTPQLHGPIRSSL